MAHGDSQMGGGREATSAQTEFRPARAEAATHPARWVPRRSGPPRASLVAVAGRAAGILLWHAATPESLPVRGEASTKSHPSPVARVLSAGAMLASLAAVVLFGLAAWGGAEMRGIQRDFLRNPPGVSLTDCAAQLRERSPSGWWTLFHPGAKARLAGLAGRIEQGRERLVEAARLYAACGERLAELGPVGRREAGGQIWGPLAEALRRIEAPWHRGTLAFHELSRVVEVYAKPPAEADLRLRGDVVALSPGHKVQIRVLLPAGPADGGLGGQGSQGHAGQGRANQGQASQFETGPLGLGGKFDLPAAVGATVVFRDLASACPDCVLEIREEYALPIERWSERPIVFPRSATTVQLRFDETTTAWAPAPAPLGPAIQRQLGLVRGQD